MFPRVQCRVVDACNRSGHFVSALLISVLFCLQSMLYLNGCIYLFGGTTGFFYNCDMFRLDLASKEWERICHPPADSPAPSARCVILSMTIKSGVSMHLTE